MRPRNDAAGGETPWRADGGSWPRRHRLHWRLDPLLRAYLATIAALFAESRDLAVLDISAGSGWLAQFGFRRYASLDIVPPHERWDIQTPLPSHHVGRYDRAVCLGALHFSIDPRASVTEFVRALRPEGDLVISTLWLYPPHDRTVDLWRISPRATYRLLDEHFTEVDLYPLSSVFSIPLHVLSRIISGPFRGVDEVVLERARHHAPAPVERPDSVDDIPIRWLSPVGLVAHAKGRR